MDKFSSFFESKTEKQKVLIGIGFSVLVLFLLLVSYLITTPVQTKSQVQNSQVPEVSAIPKQNSNTPQFPITSKTQTESYSNYDFQIKYPSTFSYQEQSLSGGGESLILKPNTPDGNATYIEIQVYSLSSASQSAVENVFSALGYSKSQIFVANLPATEFKGSIAQDSSYVREIAVIFTNKNRVYKIQLAYVSKQDNQEIEQIFNNLVSGFIPSTGY
jgi:hypothetical protein